MRLYVTPFAPNVLRTQIVLAEKGLAAEVVDVSADREAYLRINPLGQVPALELDDGRVLTESLTICHYLDACSGSPKLFGETPDERLTISMWERRAEMTLFNPAVEYGHHVHPMFAGRTPQFPDFAATLVPRIRRAIEVLANRLEVSPHLAGDHFSAADATATLGVAFCAGYGLARIDERQAIAAWFARILERESMASARLWHWYRQTARHEAPRSDSPS